MKVSLFIKGLISLEGIVLYIRLDINEGPRLSSAGI